MKRCFCLLQLTDSRGGKKQPGAPRTIRCYHGLKNISQPNYPPGLEFRIASLVLLKYLLLEHRKMIAGWMLKTFSPIQSKKTGADSQRDPQTLADWLWRSLWVRVTVWQQRGIKQMRVLDSMPLCLHCGWIIYYKLLEWQKSNFQGKRVIYKNIIKFILF